MILSKFSSWGVLALVLAPALAFAEKPAADEPMVDPELDFEVAYIEALVNNGYPDFAAPVAAAAKKRWAEADVRLFAIEVRGLLSLGKFEEAEKMIAALPSRDGVKYWAARLEVANNYFRRNRKDECRKIYDEFFTRYPKPPKEIGDFYSQAKDSFGQLLAEDGEFAKAARVYDELLESVPRQDWCIYAAEAAKLYVKAAEAEAGSKGKGESNLAAADKIVSRLLWRTDEPVYFGQAVSMRAHIEELRGRLDRAEEVLEDNLAQLQELHNSIMAEDPDGSRGNIRQSPLPECLYLRAKMLWRAAQSEFRKPNRDDEKIKSFMFGARDPATKKRNGKGAYNIALKVFLNYELSPWAASAGELADEVKAFAEKNYGAKIRTTVTPEQLARVRSAQFKAAHGAYLADNYKAAADAYFQVLASYPELVESVESLANLIDSLLELADQAESEAERACLRLDADAVEGYLSERFAASRNRELMIAAGNAVCQAAARENDRQQPARSERLYRAFFSNYSRHPNAPVMAAAKASEAQQRGDWGAAVVAWETLATEYTNSSYYAVSLLQLSYCYGKQGDHERELEFIGRYLEVETSEVKRLKAEMLLAQMNQKDGFALLESVGTNTTAEAEATVAAATEKITDAIARFERFAAAAVKAAAQPSVTKVDREQFDDLREAALYLVADCYCHLLRPESAAAAMRSKAAEGFERYVREFPKGKYVKAAYVRLGTIYTAAGDLMKSKDALDRLAKNFPDSDEAKNALPRLAKSLIEIGLVEEGAKIYADMIHADGKYTATQYLNAGEALTDARSWSLANEAYEKAIRLAGEDQVVTAARARLGLARTSFRQGRLIEAYQALDEFLGDERMSKMMISVDARFLMVDVASALGEKERDATLRDVYFGAAIGALGKVRSAWAKQQRPASEQDELNLLSGEVVIRRMNAEEAMGLKDESMASCRNAASTFLAFIQSRGPGEERPIEMFESGERANLERAYVDLIPLYSRMGADFAKDVLRFSDEYFRYFPGGKDRTLINNCINRAKADSLSNGERPAAKGE